MLHSHDLEKLTLQLEISRMICATSAELRASCISQSVRIKKNAALAKLTPTYGYQIWA